MNTHYETISGIYDHKWRRYNASTLNAALKALDLFGKEMVLDIGCGTGEFERLAISEFPNLNIIGIDIAPSMLDVARTKFSNYPKINFKIASADSLPFEPEVFDVVVLNNMLHHVEDVKNVLKESVRVLRRGGQLVVVDWCKDFISGYVMDIWFRLTERACIRIYNLDELRKIIEGLGFTVRRTSRFLAPPMYQMMLLYAAKPK